MMLVVVSAILASLAIGVTISYVLCGALFMLFRMHVRAHRVAPVQVAAKVANL